MTTTFAYSMLTNFQNGVNPDDLAVDIRENPNITTPLISVEIITTDIVIKFTTSLTPEEITALNAIITNYNPSSRIFSTPLTILRHITTIGTNGGDMTKKIWNTRPLNTIENGSEQVKLNTLTSRFRLDPGQYQVTGTVEAGNIGDHRIRIHNITTDTTSFYSLNSTTLSKCLFSGIITSTSRIDEWELQHICSRTQLSDGMGRSTALAETELFAVVEIRPI